jgi:hypothetical protein
MSDTVVFVGPSLDAETAAGLLPGAEIRPPIRRGDLRQARAEGARIAVVVDGVFAHTLAVAPREIVQVLRTGAAVVGASSMGAIRAAECAPAGMIGIGQVYEGYRAGRLLDDDEVAVVTDPDSGHRAVSVPLVTVRTAVSAAIAAGSLGDADADSIVAAAAGLHFSERTWRRIALEAGVDDPSLVTQLRESPDPKRQDAIAALEFVHTNRDSLLPETVPPPLGLAFPDDERYSGHDPLLGESRRNLQVELLRWLTGSGRLQRYVWALVAGEPEFLQVSHTRDDERPGALREGLAVVLARLLRDPDRLAARLWAELEFIEQLEAEIVFLHAVKSAQHGAVSREGMIWARERVAIAQGYRDWRSLQADVQGGAVYGAIPLVWVEDAVDMIAAANVQIQG